jgi:hypothetical protein
VAAFAGGAYAAAQQSGANARQAFLNDVAKQLHVTPKQLSSALKNAAVDQLHAAVAAGRLTQAQADALQRRIAKGGVPLPGGFGLFGRGLLHRFAVPGAAVGPGFGGPGGPGPRALAGGLHPHGPIEAAATYLGLTPIQLFEQLRSGSSLAQVAKSRGKSVSGLQSAITAAVKARLDKAVAAKWLTSAQEQKILGRLSARLGEVIDRGRSGPRFGFRAPGKLIPHRSWR